MGRLTTKCIIEMAKGFTTGKYLVGTNKTKDQRPFHVRKRKTYWQHIYIYIVMILQFLETRLIQNRIMDTVVLHDGLLVHFANIVRDYLHQTFPGRWINRGLQRLRDPSFPDLTP